MSPERFEHLLAMAAQFIWNNDTRFRKCTSVAESLPLTLWFSARWDAQHVFHIYIYIYRFGWNPNFLQLYSMHFYFSKHHVSFTTFCFCGKDKDKSLFSPLIFLFSWIEKDFSSDIFRKVKCIFKPKSEFSWLVNLSLCFVFILLQFKVCSAIIRKIILPVPFDVKLIPS